MFKKNYNLCYISFRYIQIYMHRTKISYNIIKLLNIYKRTKILYKFQKRLFRHFFGTIYINLKFYRNSWLYERFEIAPSSRESGSNISTHSVLMNGRSWTAIRWSYSFRESPDLVVTAKVQFTVWSLLRFPRSWCRKTRRGSSKEET